MVVLIVDDTFCLSIEFYILCHDFKMSHNLLLTNVTLYINYLLCFVIFVINFKTGTLWSIMFQNLFSISDENEKCLTVLSNCIYIYRCWSLSAEYMFVH